ncbi:hypothetical protein EAG_12478 [Camponotus floridanus]|uniref:Uncharacterized protein n=1 Tax=Camponotus floridanus TaxID=104421 RepID=E2B1B9_CAMFO|nr:hypothetical protein EAG_12478 [Camponotus floridanus]
MRATATLIPTWKPCLSTRSEFTISHLALSSDVCVVSLENASPQAEEEKEEAESEGAGGEGRSVETQEVQAKESESGGLGWVGLHQHHTSTDMVPSEGEDGVGRSNLGLTEWNYVTLRWRIGHGKVEIGRVKTPAIVSDGFGRVKALS